MDVDYDFFDTPVQGSSQQTTSNSRTPLTNDSKGNSKWSSTPPAPQPRSRSQPAQPDSESETESDYSTDFSTDDASDDVELPRKRIEAILPEMAVEHDDETDKDSGRRAPTPDEASTARSDNFSSESDVGPSTKEPSVLMLKKANLQSKSVRKSESDDSYATDSDADSDVTDVSPLHSPSTPHIKHQVDFMEPAVKRPPSSKLKQHAASPNKSARSRPVSAEFTSSKMSSRMEQLLNANHDSVDMKLLLEAVMEMERDQGYSAAESTKSHNRKPNAFKPTGPAPIPKKNYSFSNDSVRTIDLENQRLMQSILKHAVKSKKSKSQKSQKAPPQPKVAAGTKASTAAINRRKQQLQIEAENQAFLKRLQSTTATRNIQRDRLMHDYSKTMLYGYSVAAAHQDRKKKSPYDVSSQQTRSSSSLTGRRSRPQSAGVRSQRPLSAQTAQRQRPHSATVRLGSDGAGSGKHYPTFKPVAEPKPTWDEKW